MPAKGFTPLYAKKRPMRVAVLVSDDVTTLEKTIENSIGKGSNHEIVVVFSDNERCKAGVTAGAHGIPYESVDIAKFCLSKGYREKADAPLTVREEYDKKVIGLLGPYEVDCIVMCEYSSIVTRSFLEKYPLTINLHPADLTIKDDNCGRKYVGMHAVRDAILAGEKSLRSTTHIAMEKVDCGEILVVSRPVRVELPDGTKLSGLGKLQGTEKMDVIVKENRDRLRKSCDRDILQLTIDWISMGRFAIDENGTVCLDHKPMPDGYRME